MLRTLLGWFSLGRIRRLVVRLFVLWLLLLPVLGSCVHFYGQNEQIRPTDAIIVLGAGLRRDGSPGPALTRRAAHAARIWQEGFAPSILCSGGNPGQAVRSEAAACAQLLREQGVPAEVIVLEDSSRSTEENAIRSRAIMAERGWRDAVLVTDGYHMLRAQWIFSSEGLPVYASPVVENRLTPGEYLSSIAREIIALHWQFFKGLLGLPITYVGGL